MKISTRVKPNSKNDEIHPHTFGQNNESAHKGVYFLEKNVSRKGGVLKGVGVKKSTKRILIFA